jgi:hypothetical protein
VQLVLLSFKMEGLSAWISMGASGRLAKGGGGGKVILGNKESVDT